MFEVKFVPTKIIGAKEVTRRTSTWYFGAHGSDPQRTHELAIEVASNILETDHSDELGVYYTLEAEPFKYDPTTVSELQSIFEGGVVINDRGNGSGGPQYLPEEEARESVDEVSEVSRDEDPEAWMLATDAAEALGFDPPTIVCVGARGDGDNGFQMIYSV